MSIVLHEDGSGRAVIFNRATGAVLPCSVPTAMENVANGRGIWVHGTTGEPWDGVVPVTPASPFAAPLDLTLTQDDVLPLPAGEIGINETAIVADPVDDLADARTTPGDSPEKLEAIEREVDEANAAKPNPLDHDGDGKSGGSKPRKPVDPERVALFAALDAKGVKYFKGATTDVLKAKLADA